MTHLPIKLLDISYSINGINLLEPFSTIIYPKSRIAIIGDNGAGKTSLLELLHMKLQKYNVGYIWQNIKEFTEFSGGEKFNKSLSQSLKNNPDILLLDEPTNHLDSKNRSSLRKLIKYFRGTIIFVSHDIELLDNHAEIIWEIEKQKVNIFSGNYLDYRKNKQDNKIRVEKNLESLNKDRKKIHQKLMQEQHRSASSKKAGGKNIDNRKWPTVTSKCKASRSQKTSGRIKKEISEKREKILIEKEKIDIRNQANVSFQLTQKNSSKDILNIKNGSIRYRDKKEIISNIYFNHSANSKIAILGENASGKSSFAKAIINSPEIIRKGEWHVPESSHIGYLDQHYQNLDHEYSIIEALKNIRPEWNHQEIRSFLNQFLFRKDHQINNKIKNLSAGEKVRLSLALIAAKTPALLILDEITNNIDLSTKDYLINILKNYPSNMLIISHDVNFLKKIDIDEYYQIDNHKMNKI